MISFKRLLRPLSTAAGVLASTICIAMSLAAGASAATSVADSTRVPVSVRAASACAVLDGTPADGAAGTPAKGNAAYPHYDGGNWFPNVQAAANQFGRAIQSVSPGVCTSVCQSNATWPKGGSQCVCNSGFAASGTACTPRQLCAARPTTVPAACPPGWTGSASSTTTTSCSDPWTASYSTAPTDYSGCSAPDSAPKPPLQGAVTAVPVNLGCSNYSGFVVYFAGAPNFTLAYSRSDLLGYAWNYIASRDSSFSAAIPRLSSYYYTVNSDGADSTYLYPGIPVSRFVLTPVSSPPYNVNAGGDAYRMTDTAFVPVPCSE